MKNALLFNASCQYKLSKHRKSKLLLHKPLLPRPPQSQHPQTNYIAPLLPPAAMHSVIKQRPAPQSPRYPLQTSGFSNTPTTLKRPPSLTELNELSIDKRNRLEGNSSGQRSRRMGLTATGTASAGEAEFKAETQTDDLATMSRTEQRQQAGRVKYLHSRGIECPNAVSYGTSFPSL